MKAFWLEFKRITVNPIFLIYALLVIAFIMLNVWPLVTGSLTKAPQPGNTDYITATDYQTLKHNALSELKDEHQANTYATYPLGFEKQVTLSVHKQERVSYYLKQAKASETKATLTQNLNSVNKLLGGASNYSRQNLQGLASRPMTMAEANHDHHLILTKDRISGSFARLFGDIAGIIMGILPTILIIAYCYTDRKSKALPVIQVKRTSTAKWVSIRYLASLAALLLPVLLTAVLFTVRIAILYHHFQINNFAFLQAILFWILPTVMVSSSVGFLSYALFGNFSGFIIQIGWWISTMIIGARQVTGNYGWLFIPRHNSLHNVAYFYDHLSQLIINRISYALLAIFLLGITIWLLNLQRGGKYHAPKLAKIIHFGFSHQHS